MSKYIGLKQYDGTSEKAIALLLDNAFISGAKKNEFILNTYIVKDMEALVQKLVEIIKKP